MRSNIMKKSRNSIVSTLPQIKFSEELTAAIKAEATHPDPSSAPYLPRAVVTEARQVAEAMTGQYFTPLEPDALRDFIEDLYDTLNAIVCNPTDSDTLAIRVTAACMVLAEIPRRVFHDEFIRTCLSRFRFMPAPAELLAVAEELAQEWRKKIAQVRLIVTHDESKRFTLGYPPSRESELLQLSSERSDQLQQQLDDALGM